MMSKSNIDIVYNDKKRVFEVIYKWEEVHSIVYHVRAPNKEEAERLIKDNRTLTNKDIKCITEAKDTYDMNNGWSDVEATGEVIEGEF